MKMEKELGTGKRRNPMDLWGMAYRYPSLCRHRGGLGRSKDDIKVIK
jgi:hypothetical protein